LIVAGEFGSAGGIPAKNLAIWDGVKWDTFDINPVKNWSRVYHINVYNNKLYIQNYYVWDGNQWDTLDQGPGFSYVLTSLTYNDNLYYGGEFSTICGLKVANNVGWYDGNYCYPIGAWLDNDVHAMEVYNGELYIGGHFVTASGDTVNHIAKWSSPLEVKDEVHEVYNNTIVVYPNPFINETLISIYNVNLNKNKEFINFNLYDICGKKQNVLYKLLNLDKSKIIIKLQRGNLSSGIYFYRISTLEGIIGDGKLLIF